MLSSRHQQNVDHKFRSCKEGVPQNRSMLCMMKGASIFLWYICSFWLHCHATRQAQWNLLVGLPTMHSSSTRPKRDLTEQNDGGGARPCELLSCEKRTLSIAQTETHVLVFRNGWELESSINMQLILEERSAYKWKISRPLKKEYCSHRNKVATQLVLNFS